MRKIKYMILGLLVALLVPLNAYAASGSITTRPNYSTIVLGNTVTYTVTLSSSEDIGSWDMLLSYDSSMLQLTSSTGETNSTQMVNSSAGTKSVTYKFYFKTLKTGSTTVSVNSYQVYANSDMSKMSMSSSGGTITIKTQQEIIDSYSKDNNLKGLTVEGFELKEEFAMDTLEYSVEVPEGTEEIKVNADVNDYRSSVEGSGTLAVTPGINTFEIIVRAQNGSEKIYKLTVNVIDQNPINVSTDIGNMTVVKLEEQLEMPNSYTASTVTIGEFEIPAFYNENLDYTLVGLKDAEGNVSLYIYDETSSSYTKYVEFKFSGLIIVPIDTDKVLEGYITKTEDIFEVSTNVFKTSSNSKFSVFYGKNVLTGEESFYTYDIENESVIKYDDSYINELNEEKELYLYVIMGLAGFVVILFIIIFSLIGKNKKVKKSKVKTETFEEVEETKETVEDIPAKEKKTKKKKEKKKKNNDDFDF